MTVTRVTVAPGHWLAPGPAAALTAALAAGMPRQITDAGRTRAEQAALYKQKGPKGAEHPDSPRAFHMTGEAVDLGRAATAWLLEHPEYGFRRTIAREWWHWQWFRSLATYQEDTVEITDQLSYDNPAKKQAYTAEEAWAVAANYSFYVWEIIRRLELQVAGLTAAVQTLAAAASNGDDVDVDVISAAVRDGIADALGALEADVRLTIDPTT